MRLCAPFCRASRIRFPDTLPTFIDIDCRRPPRDHQRPSPCSNADRRLIRRKRAYMSCWSHGTTTRRRQTRVRMGACCVHGATPASPAKRPSQAPTYLSFFLHLTLALPGILSLYGCLLNTGSSCSTSLGHTDSEASSSSAWDTWRPSSLSESSLVSSLGGLGAASLPSDSLFSLSHPQPVAKDPDASGCMEGYALAPWPAARNSTSPLSHPQSLGFM
ncbi:hypothetical protein OH77DRAFT_709803 [Trametes cingulata]|nr:hypothetical protein OH77DRAFT_709803 [Trametes cingulata]